MILRLTRSSLPLYGRPLMIASDRALPMPGSASSSSALAELMSTIAALPAGAAGAGAAADGFIGCAAVGGFIGCAAAGGLAGVVVDCVAVCARAGIDSDRASAVRAI